MRNHFLRVSAQSYDFSAGISVRSAISAGLLSALFCLTASSAAFGQDITITTDNANVGGAPSKAPATTNQTTAAVDHHGYLGHEAASVKPEVGVLEFTDPTGATDGRLAAGIGLDNNFVSMLNAEPSSLYFGVSTGVLFSHLGDPTSNFFGTNAGANFGLSGANALMIPLDLKIGYSLTDFVRISAHGGGNVFYRSVASAMNLDVSSSATPAPSWDIFPDVGADLELAITPAAAVLIRPDWTFTTGNGVFSGIVGLSLIIG